MTIDNKVFVVTGAGGGIGGALVKELIANGAHVAAIDLKEESLQNLAKTVNSDRLTTHALNISDKAAVETVATDINNAHDNIDGLINCAGIIQPFIKINDLDYETIERVMNVNFYGTVYMTKTFLPTLLARPEAHIVNVSSMGGFLPVPGQSVYGASKAAVKLFTEGLYAELLNTNVTVSIVFPGATATNITQNSGVQAPAMGSDKDASSYKMLSAEDAAKIIVLGIQKNKPQIFTGQDSKFMNKLYRINAVYATKFIAKKMQNLLQ